MAYSNGSTSACVRQRPQTTPERLAAVLAALPIDDLLAALRAPTGRPGYGVRVLLNAYIAAFVLNTDSISAALRRIDDDPRLAEVVGGTPSKFALCRFVKKLKDHIALLETVMARVTTMLREALPDLGKVVAIDSTDIRSWSRKTDTEGAWSAKLGTDGRKKFWHGFKANVVCDAAYELPLDVHVTPANMSDSVQIKPSLERLAKSGFAPQYVLADAGYDAAENYRAITDDFHAVPIIKLNLRGRRSDGFRSPHRPAAYVAANMRGLELRHSPGVARDSVLWQDLYSRRGSVERTFARLKGFRRINKLTMRGLAKATLHCLCAVLALLVLATVAVMSGCSIRIRESVV